MVSTHVNSVGAAEPDTMPRRQQKLNSWTNSQSEYLVLLVVVPSNYSPIVEQAYHPWQWHGHWQWHVHIIANLNVTINGWLVSETIVDILSCLHWQQHISSAWIHLMGFAAGFGSSSTYILTSCQFAALSLTLSLTMFDNAIVIDNISK